jgi:hypothetical protein
MIFQEAFYSSSFPSSRIKIPAYRGMKNPGSAGSACPAYFAGDGKKDKFYKFSSISTTFSCFSIR